MPLTGSTRTFSLSAIVRLIHTEAKTGVLKVTRGENTAGLYFKNGEIVFISGELTQDLSLSSLLKAGKITSEENIQKSLEIARTTVKRLETVLLELGYIPQNKLANILRYQFKEVLANVLTWDEGEFNYTDGIGDYFEDLRLQIDPIRLMADAQKWREYRSLIPNDQAVFQIKAGIKPDSLSGDRFSRVMLLINGQRNVAQIIAETGLSRLAVYSALTALASRGAIVRSEAPNGAIIIAFYSKVIQMLMRDLKNEVGAKALDLLANILMRSEYYDIFLSQFDIQNSIGANAERIQEHIRTQGHKLGKQGMVRAFQLVLLALMQEQKRLLGDKAARISLIKLKEHLADPAQKNYRPLADHLVAFLQNNNI